MNIQSFPVFKVLSHQLYMWGVNALVIVNGFCGTRLSLDGVLGTLHMVTHLITNSLNPHQKPYELVSILYLLSYPLPRWGSWDPEKMNKLPTIN